MQEPKSGYRHPHDGPWAWLVLFAVWFANVTFIGFVVAFGVLLPDLREYFNKSRQSVGRCKFSFDLCNIILVYL